MDDDVATGNHLRRVPYGMSVLSHATELYEIDSHVVVHLHLRERCNLFGGEAKGDVSRRITRASLDTSPVLDLRHDHIDAFAQEVVHVLAGQLARDGKVLTLPDAEAGDRFLGCVSRGAHIGDGLHNHAGNVKVRGVGHGVFDHGVYCDTLDLGHVAECDGFPQQPQHIATSGSAQIAVLEVW